MTHLQAKTTCVPTTSESDCSLLQVVNRHGRTDGYRVNGYRVDGKWVPGKRVNGWMGKLVDG